MKNKTLKLAIALFISAINVTQASVLNIIKLEDPILTANTNIAVSFPLSDEEKTLIEDMKDTLENDEGAVGLAAPQIEKNLKIIVYKIPKDLPDNLKDPEAPNEDSTYVLINPTYKQINMEETEEGWEGCLSMPDLYDKVIRFKTVQVTYQDMAGNIQTKIAKLFHARVIQHELDHINTKGEIIYAQRMPEIKWGINIGYAEQIKQLVINK